MLKLKKKGVSVCFQILVFTLILDWIFFRWIFSTGCGDVDTLKVVKADVDGCILVFVELQVNVVIY